MTTFEDVAYRDERLSGGMYAAVGAGVASAAGAAGRAVAGPSLATAGATAITVGGHVLRTTAEQIGAALGAGDLERARATLPALVGRDPSVARRRGDGAGRGRVGGREHRGCRGGSGLLGPVAGAVGAAAYRAINTMDAMVGHHSPRYERTGGLRPASTTGSTGCRPGSQPSSSPRCVPATRPTSGGPCGWTRRPTPHRTRGWSKRRSPLRSTCVSGGQPLSLRRRGAARPGAGEAAGAGRHCRVPFVCRVRSRPPSAARWRWEPPSRWRRARSASSGGHHRCGGSLAAVAGDLVYAFRVMRLPAPRRDGGGTIGKLERHRRLAGAAAADAAAKWSVSSPPPPTVAGSSSTPTASPSSTATAPASVRGTSTSARSSPSPASCSSARTSSTRASATRP